ncbi:MAG TPA: hypothetical protein VKA08_02880 [Balneolales bacterium]|nr:hypothetical protein [Balneolales bacterium]
MDFTSMIKKPGAFLPLVMSFAALATVIIHIILFGVARQADEGVSAHIFQLLIVAEVPVVVFFTIKWLPKFPRQTLETLALQILAVLAALAPVFYFHF